MEEGVEQAPQDPIERKSTRGTLTAVACEGCRKRKSKCDGERPTCSTCRSKGLSTCVYETGLNGSRIQQLRRQNQSLKHELAALQTGRCIHHVEKDCADCRRRDYGPCRDELLPSPEQMIMPDTLMFPSRAEANTLLGETREQPADAKGFPDDRPRDLDGEGQLMDLLNQFSSGYSLGRRDQLRHNFYPINDIQPRENRHDSPISEVLSNFRRFARQAIANGESEARVLGSFEIDTGVVFSNRNFDAASFLSQFAGQVVSAWGLPSLAPKIGMMYMMFKLMRWHISLSQTDLDDIPEAMKPTPTQLFVTHPLFIDFLVWPRLRDIFISQPAIYTSPPNPTGRVEHIIRTINLANSFSCDEILYGEPTTGHFRMKPSFKTYIENVDNWTLDRELAETIPQLKGEVRLR